MKLDKFYTKNRKYVFISSALILLIVGLQFTGKQKRIHQKKARPVLSVDTTQLTEQNFDILKGYIGTLYASHKFALHSKVGGRVTGIHYDIGDEINNGATVAQIDDTLYRLEYKQALGKLDIEKSKVRQKEMSIALAEKEYQRMLALRDEKVISESALEKAKFDFEQKKMTFDVDKAGLKMQETAVEMSELRWSYTDIKAKWTQTGTNGTRILAERLVDQGSMITPNTAIATIIDIGLLKAEIFVGENEYPHFKPGMQVKIDVDAFPGKIFAGTVKRVAPFINEQTRQAKVQIDVKNPELKLRPGMFARTRVIFKTREAVPMLPKICIVKQQDQDGIFLYDPEDEHVSFLPVQVGTVRGNNAEIINAEEITLPVICIGQHMLKDGVRVSHVDRSAKKPGANKPQKAK